MDTVYLDPKTSTIKYENDTEGLIPIETDKEPRHMSYEEITSWVKDLIEKYIGV